MVYFASGDWPKTKSTGSNNKSQHQKKAASSTTTPRGGPTPPPRRAQPLLLLSRSNPPTEGGGVEKKAAIFRNRITARWELGKEGSVRKRALRNFPVLGVPQRWPISDVSILRPLIGRISVSSIGYMYRGKHRKSVGFLLINTGASRSHQGCGLASTSAAALASSSRRRLFFRETLGKLPPFEVCWSYDSSLRHT